MASETRWNWKLVAGVTVAGASGVLVGAWLQDWTSDAWGGVLVEVGAGLGLVAAIVFLERRLLREVSERAESAAREAATTATREATEDLRERITRLEDLERAQEEGRESYDEVGRRVVEQVAEGVSFENVARLLREAKDRQYFAPEFRVRGSGAIDCEVLYFELDDYSFVSADEGPRIRLAFDPFVPDGFWDLQSQLDRQPEDVIWTPDMAVDDLVAELSRLLDSSNRPPDGFSLAYAIPRLLDSFDVMKAARAAPSTSGHRLTGQLRTWINPGWVMTNKGLESTESPATLEVQLMISGSHGGLSSRLYVPSEMLEVEDPQLDDALQWAQEREVEHVIHT